MSADNRKVVDALEMGIEAEIEGRDYYSFAATQTREPKAVAMFKSLARDEAMHLAKLLGRYEVVGEPGERPWSAGVAEGVLGSGWHGDRLPWPRHRTRENLPTHLTELRALEIGIRTEHEVLALYLKAAAVAADPGTRAVFREIAVQEEGHVRMLEAEHAFLKKTGFWFGAQEFSLEKEG